MSRPGRTLPPGKIRYPSYRRLGGPQGWSGQVRKISPPPGFFFISHLYFICCNHSCFHTCEYIYIYIYIYIYMYVCMYMPVIKLTTECCDFHTCHTTVPQDGFTHVTIWSNCDSLVASTHWECHPWVVNWRHSCYICCWNLASSLARCIVVSLSHSSSLNSWLAVNQMEVAADSWRGPLHSQQ